MKSASQLTLSYTYLLVSEYICVSLWGPLHITSRKTCYQHVDCLFPGPELWTNVCAVLNGNRVGLKSRISSDGFRTPNVQLVWGELNWVDCVDNGIRYGLFHCVINVSCILTLARRDNVLCADIACLREKFLSLDSPSVYISEQLNFHF
jgi:hypothetical protein